MWFWSRGSCVSYNKEMLFLLVMAKLGIMTWEEPGAQGWELGWEQAERRIQWWKLERHRAEITENKEIAF